MSINRKRLIDLAVWVAGEEAKRKLGVPSQWFQGDWFVANSEAPCGTACCMAGKVALDDGAKPFPLEDGTVNYGGRIELPDGRRVHVADYARTALGLDFDQADRLFAGGNRYERVMEIIGGLLRTV